MADFEDRLKQLEDEIERRLVERFAALRDEFDRLRLESDHRWAGFLDRFDQKFTGIVPLELMQPEPEAPAPPSPAPAPAGGHDVADAARALDEAGNQVEALHRFLDLCRRHASRAALLVTRGGSAFVWKAVGFSDHGVSDEMIRKAALPAVDGGVLGRVLEGHPCELEAGNEISRALSAEDATRAVLIAMVVKEKISGALYADCAAEDEGRFDPESLAFLTFFAGLIVDRLASRKLKPAPALRPLERAAVPSPSAFETPVPEPAAPPPAARPAPPSEPEFELAEEPSPPPPAAPRGYGTQMMPAVPEPTPPAPKAPPPPQFYGAPEEASIESPFGRPSREIPIALPPLEPELSLAEEPAPGATMRIPSSLVDEALAAPPPPPAPEPLRPPPPPPPPPAPAPPARPSTGVRRLAGPLAPAEGDERREEARRFAKLLVSEIKLYNEKAVAQGREQGNIYELLKEDIDRSRQMYDERIPEDVRAGSNFFYEELVRILADGRADALGL